MTDGVKTYRDQLLEKLFKTEPLVREKEEKRQKAGRHVMNNINGEASRTPRARLTPEERYLRSMEKLRAFGKAYRASEAWRIANRRKSKERRATLAGKYSLWKHGINMRRKKYEKEGDPRFEFYVNELSISEWCLFWLSAGEVLMPDGTKKAAWKATGRSDLDVRMKRHDEWDTWRLGNMLLWYRGQVLVDGRKLETPRSGP